MTRSSIKSLSFVLIEVSFPRFHRATLPDSSNKKVLAGFEDFSNLNLASGDLFDSVSK